MTAMKNTALPPDDAEIVRRLCEMDESLCHEFKRVSNKMVHKALETIVAFANTEGGILVLGMEDYKKAQGKDRLYGIQDNPEAVDELRRRTRCRGCPEKSFSTFHRGGWNMETSGARQSRDDRRRDQWAFLRSWRGQRRRRVDGNPVRIAANGGLVNLLRHQETDFGRHPGQDVPNRPCQEERRGTIANQGGGPAFRR